jgi:cell division protein FtsQ
MKNSRRVLCSVAGFCLVLAAAYLVNESRQSNFVPQISLVSELSQDQQAELLQVLLSEEQAVDLGDISDIKNKLEAINWVHKALVTRKWPGDIILDIRQQQAIAYWNDDGFINPYGEVFVTDDLNGGDLPQLYGPQDSAPRVMEEFQQLNRVLFKTGRSIEILTLNDRGAWEFQDQSGIRILLGKEDIQQRLYRSIEVLERIAQQDTGQKPVRVDARYNNGVSIQWMETLEIAKNFKLQRDMSL